MSAGLATSTQAEHWTLVAPGPSAPWEWADDVTVPSTVSANARTVMRWWRRLPKTNPLPDELTRSDRGHDSTLQVP